MTSRRIELSGQDNFRDLGGYETADGRRVKWRHLFRSGELCELSEGDVECLAALGVRTVVDLRGESEVERKGPDRLPAGASLTSIAIEPGDLSPFLGRAFSTGDFGAVPEDLLPRINRDYIQSWRHQLGALLRIAADPANRPLVFHCTQGKDRAGISAAVLLSALGVPWETVLEDYLLSNELRREQAEAGLHGMRKSADTICETECLGEQVDTSIESVFTDKRLVFRARSVAGHDDAQLRTLAGRQRAKRGKQRLADRAAG